MNTKWKYASVKEENGFYTLDLHGVYHRDVEREVELFLYEHRYHLNMKIECGNSERMKKIVTEYLDSHQYKWMKSIDGGYGTISIIRDWT